MADENEIDPTSSDESTPLDPRGDDLAAQDLPVAGAYSIAPDEHEAEELDETTAPDDELVDDPEQLAEAEDEARAAETIEPVTLSRRPKRKSAARNELQVNEPGDASDVSLGDSAASSLRPKKRTTEVAKKDHATPKRKSAAGEPEHHRTGPVQFVKESVGELRKVVWPTGSQLSQYFVVVLVFVLFIIAYVLLLDLGFGTLLMHFLGGA